MDNVDIVVARPILAHQKGPTMRDGIHKTLALSRHWKRALELLGNDAEPEDEIVQRLEEALLGEIKKESEPEALRRMVTRVGQRQPTLFPTEDVRGLWRECTDDRVPTPLESRWLDHADRLAGGGTPTRQHLTQGLGEALSERLQARVLDMLRHVAQESPHDYDHVRQRVERLANRVPIDGYLAPLTDGQLPGATTSDRPLDLDEGLPLGPMAP